MTDLTKWQRSKALHERIDKTRAKLGTSTRRGMGTGSGKRKGSTNCIPHRVREVLATAQKALTDGLPYDEIARYLAVVSLTEPDVFKQAVKHAPRGPGTWGIAVRPATMIRPEVLNPPIEQVAKYLSFDVDVLARLRKVNRQVYDRMAWDFIQQRLTPGEFALIKALQYQRVREAFERLSSRHCATL